MSSRAFRAFSVISVLAYCALATSSAGCLIYGEDLLLESDTGAGGQGGVGGGTGGGECISNCTHLLISEVVVQPTPGEFVEIYNPGTASVGLDDVWLSDVPTYFMGSAATVGDTDFLVRFPAGSSIGAGERITVAIDSISSFNGAYQRAPDYVIHDMLGQASANQSGLSNQDEMLILFEWDGSAPLKRDLDYVLWGDASDAMDKTGQVSGGEAYANDTPPAQQSVVSAPANGEAMHRCGDSEPGEIAMGGNGVIGHDETSEDLSAAFRNAAPTPGAEPPSSACP